MLAWNRKYEKHFSTKVQCYYKSAEMLEKSQGMVELGLLFRRLCLLVLAAAVLVQALQQVQKYLARYTVIGRTMEKVSEI